jgi:predicted glycosyltransferase involved in capsule biosynthesis
MSLSIIIPIKLDSEDRKNNLTTLLNYLVSYNFKKEIILVEQIYNNNNNDYSFLKNISNKFYKIITCNFNYDYFHKTKLINVGIENAIYKNLCIQDCDCLLTEEQFLESISLLNNLKTAVKPFNSYLINIPKSTDLIFSTIREDFLTELKLNLELINLNFDKFKKFNLISPNPPGGCLLLNKNFIKSIGNYNVNFKAYGPEDAEILYRIKKLSYTVGEVNGFIYHLEHDRTQDSCCHFLAKKYKTNANPHISNNNLLFEYIKQLDLDQLKKYYNIK